MASIRIRKDIHQGEIMVTFLHDPKFVAMVKTIEGHRWHPDKKYWSFLHSDRGRNRFAVHQGAFETCTQQDYRDLYSCEC